MWPHLGNSFAGQAFIIVHCTMLQLSGCCCSGNKGIAFAARVHPGTPLLCSLGTKNHLLRTIDWHKKSLWEGEQDWNTLKNQAHFHFPSFFSYTFAVWIQKSIPFVAGPQQSTPQNTRVPRKHLTTSKQTNKQTSKQTNKQTNKQLSGPCNPPHLSHGSAKLSELPYPMGCIDLYLNL